MKNVNVGWSTSLIGTPGFASEANSTLASRFLLILCRSTLVDYNCSSRKRPGDELSSVLKLRRTDTSWFVDKVVEVDQFKKSERRELLEALGKLREDDPPPSSDDEMPIYCPRSGRNPG